MAIKPRRREARITLVVAGILFMAIGANAAALWWLIPVLYAVLV